MIKLKTLKSQGIVEGDDGKYTIKLQKAFDKYAPIKKKKTRKLFRSYPKFESSSFSKKGQKFASSFYGALTGSSIPSSLGPQSKKMKRGRDKGGRPRGPSGKYVINGQPVDVYTWRKYARRMRAIQRLQGYNPQQEMIRQQIYAQQLQQQAIPSTAPQQLIQQPPNPPQASSTNILRPVGGNILQAPNFMKGELFNTGGGEDFLNVDRINKPVVNPDGDDFTDVDPLTGRIILRRRPRERWLSND